MAGNFPEKSEKKQPMTSTEAIGCFQSFEYFMGNFTGDGNRTNIMNAAIWAVPDARNKG
jgi:hypothetical protein